MRYKNRELRRLWEVDVYEGDPDDEDVALRTETLIAFNQVEAVRRAGGPVASLPRQICFVSWGEKEGDPIYRVDSPKEGPAGDPIEPSISRVEEEYWS